MQPNGEIVAMVNQTLIASHLPDGVGADPELWVNLALYENNPETNQPEFKGHGGWRRRRNLNEIEVELFRAVGVERRSADMSRKLLEEIRK